MNGKFNQRQSLIEQLNNEMGKLKQKVEQSDIRLQQYQVRTDLSAWPLSSTLSVFDGS